MTAGNRFCPSCGASLGGASRVPHYLPWVFAGLAAALLLVLLLKPGSRAPAPEAAPSAPAEAAPGTPPDLSSMSPAERFNRLYQRIITAAQTGDQATVTRFMPMATAAFGMLDTVTVDARYHMAMLELHVGDLAAAELQADSIRRADPAHLFSTVIRAAVARWKQDDKARDALYREFLARYDAEIAKRRPEYLEHQTMLEELRKTATGRPNPGA